MKCWVLRVTVVLCALAVVCVGSWWAWRTWYSPAQIRAAMQAHDAARVRLLLRWGARADKVANLLHWAAEEGRLAILEFLLANGAKVDAKDNTGETALYYAAGCLNPAVTELLLANGAKADAKDTDGTTPLHNAATGDNPAVVELLLANGAEVDARDTIGMTPLHCASDKPAVAKLLLADGAEVDVRDNDGMTPLHWAVITNSPAVVELLLANGADPNAKDKDGTTPLEEMPELAEIVKTLEAEKAKRMDGEQWPDLLALPNSADTVGWGMPMRVEGFIVGTVERAPEGYPWSRYIVKRPFRKRMDCALKLSGIDEKLIEHGGRYKLYGQFVGGGHKGYILTFRAVKIVRRKRE